MGGTSGFGVSFTFCSSPLTASSSSNFLFFFILDFLIFTFKTIIIIFYFFNIIVFRQIIKCRNLIIINSCKLRNWFSIFISKISLLSKEARSHFYMFNILFGL